MKKSIILLIFFAIIVSNCQEDQTSRRNKIIVADTYSIMNLNLYVAYEKGLFTKRGLDVKIMRTEDGVNETQDGNADIVFHDPTDVIGPIFKRKSSIVILPNWLNIAIIGQGAASCTAALVVPVDSPIKQYSDLNNEQIAGISATSCAVISMKDTLKRKYNAEFRIVPFTIGGILSALESKNLKAAILEEPFLTQTLLLTNIMGNPKYCTIFDGTDGGNSVIEKNIPGSLISTNTIFLQTRLHDAKTFLEAIDEANHIISSNPTDPGIIKITGKYITVTNEALIKSNSKLKFDIKLNKESIKDYTETLIRSGMIKQNLTDSLFAPQFKGITW